MSPEIRRILVNLAADQINTISDEVERRTVLITIILETLTPADLEDVVIGLEDYYVNLNR